MSFIAKASNVSDARVTSISLDSSLLRETVQPSSDSDDPSDSSQLSAKRQEYRLTLGRFKYSATSTFKSSKLGFSYRCLILYVS
jgi:hypothetical protein